MKFFDFLKISAFFVIFSIFSIFSRFFQKSFNFKNTQRSRIFCHKALTECIRKVFVYSLVLKLKKNFSNISNLLNQSLFEARKRVFSKFDKVFEKWTIAFWDYCTLLFFHRHIQMFVDCSQTFSLNYKYPKDNSKKSLEFFIHFFYDKNQKPRGGWPPPLSRVAPKEGDFCSRAWELILGFTT